jgi:hypothetical protein
LAAFLTITGERESEGSFLQIEQIGIGEKMIAFSATYHAFMPD